MKTSLSYGLLHTVYSAEEITEQVVEEVVDEEGNIEEKITNVSKFISVVCADEKCGRSIQNGNECFVDALNEGDVYCDPCGKCLRYERKKEQQRKQ